MICYDVEFPETVRGRRRARRRTAAGAHGAVGGFDAVPQVLVRARALESQLTVAYANHSGTEDGCDFLGGSVVAGPDGSLLAAAGAWAELLFAERRSAREAARVARDAVAYLRDRRPDIYRSWGSLTRPRRRPGRRGALAA